MADYKTFLQYDSRWGSKNYNGSSTMAQAGCGPTSVAMLAYAIDKKVTPWTVAKYMKAHGYAVWNHGTEWAGIPAAMKEFGLKDVKEVSKMSDVFKYLKKRYCAVFLFSAGTRGGITWTSSGHYVAVTSIKVKNGKHYLYTRDSGGRGNTGRHCYETQMKGLIPKVWVGYVPGNLKKKKPSKASQINKVAVRDAWGPGVPSGNYKYPTGAPKSQYTKDLNKAYPDRHSWRTQTRKGAACDVYAGTVVRISGVDKSFSRSLEYIIPDMEKTKKFKLIAAKKGKYYPRSWFKGGDIIIVLYKGGGGHIFFAVEINGKIYFSEANYNGKCWPHVSKRAKTLRKSSYKMLRVYRAVG